MTPTAFLSSCPSVPHRALLYLPSQCQLCILQSPPSPCCPQAGGSGPPSPILSCILPSVCHKPLSPLSEAQTQPSLPQLEPPVQLPGFCCNTHSNLSSFKSFNLQQLPPECWKFSFFADTSVRADASRSCSCHQPLCSVV